MAKIISFTNYKISQNYKLRLTIDVSLIRKFDGNFEVGIDYDDSDLSGDEVIINYLGNVACELSKGLNQIEIKDNDIFKVHFTILYYEGKNKDDFKFRIFPSYNRTEIAKFLYIVINAYFKK
jgi:hypothetical protein